MWWLGYGANPSRIVGVVAYWIFQNIVIKELRPISAGEPIKVWGRLTGECATREFPDAPECFFAVRTKAKEYMGSVMIAEKVICIDTAWARAHPVASLIRSTALAAAS